MRVLLLGGNGQVGHELRRSLASLGEVILTTRNGRLADGVSCESLDLADLDAIAPLVARIAPDVVVNAAAYTAVDRAEDEPELAFRINAEAPERLAGACEQQGCRLVHYSTDYVFDGMGSRPYREDDPTSPIGVYGASKLAGEEAIRASSADHLILRTAWVYGTYGHNFMRTMLRLAAERDELRVVADQVGSPTPARLIADVTKRAVSGGSLRGTYHLTAAGQTSWYGFAQAIVARAAATGLLARQPTVVGIPSGDYPTPAKRPAFSVLDTSKLASDLGLVLPGWHDGLAGVLAGVRVPS